MKKEKGSLSKKVRGDFKLRSVAGMKGKGKYPGAKGYVKPKRTGKRGK